MIDAIRATAGLAMSTFKDKPGQGEDMPSEDDLVNVDSHWRPTPELKAKMFRPIREPGKGAA